MNTRSRHGEEVAASVRKDDGAVCWLVSKKVNLIGIKRPNLK